MDNSNIFNKVKKEVKLMILETRDGLGLSGSTDCIMVFVEHTIGKTLREKDSQKTSMETKND